MGVLPPAPAGARKASTAGWVRWQPPRMAPSGT